jgi:hypothetical protein
MLKRKKGKAMPVTGHGGPEGCEMSRLPHFSGQTGCKGVDLINLLRIGMVIAYCKPLDFVLCVFFLCIEAFLRDVICTLQVCIFPLLSMFYGSLM